MSVESYQGEPTKGSAVGCIVVLLPLLAFGLALPDAIHMWRSRAALNPLLWVVGSVLLWLILKMLLDRGARRLSPFVWWSSAIVLLTVSIAVCVAIIGSI